MSSDNDPLTTTVEKGGININYDRLLGDETPANIVFVSKNDRRDSDAVKNDSNSNASSSPAEDLSQKSDGDLIGQIERVSCLFATVSGRLPDKGQKLKDQLANLRSEQERRRRLPKITQVDDGWKNPRKELQKSDDEPDKLKRAAQPAQTSGSSKFGSMLRQKLKNDAMPELYQNTGGKSRNAFQDEMSYMNPCDKRKGNVGGKLPKGKKAKNGLSSKEFSTWKPANGSENRQKYGQLDRYMSRRPSPHEKPCGSFHVKNGFECKGSETSKNAKQECTVVLVDEEEPEVIEKVQEPQNRRSRRNEIRNDLRNECKIFYPSREDPESLEILRSELRCLEPGECLTSTIMNFYIRFLQQQCSTSDNSKQFYFFNTYFYSKLQEAVARQNKEEFFIKFRRWWRGVNIFEKRYIFLPINEDNHWSLVIVCISDEEDSGLNILHLDSLGIHSSRSIFKNVKSLLENEWKYLKDDGDTAIPDALKESLSERIDGTTVEATRQTNDYDCGLFVLYYIERFIQDAPEKMKEEHLSMFGRKWFKAVEASSLRGRIKKILMEEFRKPPTADKSLYETVSLPEKSHTLLTPRETVNLS